MSPSPARSRILARAAVITAGAVMAASCGGSNDEGATVSLAAPTEVPATETTVVPASDTTASPTTLAPAATDQTTTSTAPATTSSAAPTTVAAHESATIVGGGWLLGSWDGANWVDVTGPFDSPPAVPAGLRLLPLTGSTIGVTNPSAYGACEWITEDDGSVQYQVEYSGASTEWDAPAGTTGSWELQPRPVEAVADTSPFAPLVTTYLDSVGVTDPNPSLVGAWRADLDGDGTSEIIIEARRVDNEDLISLAAGDYSIILVTAEGSGQVTALESDTIPSNAAADNSDFGHMLWATSILGVMDLNGDGTMETVTLGWGWEGSGVSVSETVNGAYHTVLSKGCGV